MRYRIETREDGLWLIMPPYLDHGPYETSGEVVAMAEEIRRGELKAKTDVQLALFEGLDCPPGTRDLF